MGRKVRGWRLTPGANIHLWAGMEGGPVGTEGAWHLHHPPLPHPRPEASPSLHAHSGE